MTVDAGRQLFAWGTVGAGGVFTLFRRAKVMFDGIPPEVLVAAVRGGRLLIRLALTDVRGEPLCAAVRPPLITWTAPDR